MKVKLHDWHQVVAAVVTIAGGIAVVWWQMHGIARDNQQVLEQLTSAVQNSAKLREAVRWPLEGRWDYSIEWDVYFDTESDPTRREQQFFSSGLADIQLQGSQYHMLLGYENATRSGTRLAVSVNTGIFEATADGLPSVGSRIDMGYSHRLGKVDVPIGESVVDFSNTPEGRYHYTITGYERGVDGDISTIHATFEVDQSKGAVVFTRLF